jgi:hypothetical protein
MARASAIACGYEDAIDLDRLRHDPLMKVVVGRCPQTGGRWRRNRPRLENAPSKTEAGRLSAALLDQFGGEAGQVGHDAPLGRYSRQHPLTLSCFDHI